MGTAFVPRRFLKTAQHLNRVPEILRCQRHTHQWLKLTSAYVGLNASLPFEVNVGSGKFQFVELSDVATFWQIFFRRIYPVYVSDRLIIDAGANIGAFTLYALQTAPQARVVAVEPAPDSCERIRSMLREHHLEDRCRLHEAALGASSGETSIQLNVGSQFRKTGVSGSPVPGIALDSVVPRGASVDLLKMDIEGAEYDVLTAVSPETLSRIRRVVLEFHPDAPYQQAVAPLIASGFRMALHRDDGEGYGVVWLDRA